MTAEDLVLPKASTGVVGLNYVLGGGLARNRLHLLGGSPGSGKTTIALQFLMAGAERGEAGIYVSLAETEEELRDGARSHGWTIEWRAIGPPGTHEIPKSADIILDRIRRPGGNDRDPRNRHCRKAI